MDVLEKAKELGEIIMQDERCKRFQIAKTAIDTDITLSEMIGEFNLKKIAMNEEYEKEKQDDDKLKNIENEMKNLYQEIMKNDNMAEYNNAKEEMDELLTHINNIIQMSISGEIDEDGCSGSCSSCSGCH